MSGLPKGWCAVTLDELAVWGSGGTPSRTNRAYFGGSIPWVKTGELHTRCVTKTEESLTEEGLANSSAKVFAEGSVVLAMYGATIGSVSVLGLAAATNQACAVGVPDLRVTNTQFLYWYLRSQQPHFVEHAKGGAQPNISQGIIRSWPLLLPPLPEQKRIADKLDALLARVDACRERLARLQRQLSQFRESLFRAATDGSLTRQWRVLKGQTESRKALTLVGSESLGEFTIPTSWSETRLSDIAEISGGIAKDSKKQSEDYIELPYLRVANVQRGFLDLSEMKTIRVPPKRVADMLLADGDILFNEGGDIDKLGRGWIWSGELPQCVFQNHVFRARLNDKSYEPRYFSWYANSRGYNFFLANGKQTTNLASISKSVLVSLPIPVPPAREQVEIVRRVSAMLELIDALELRVTNMTNAIDRLTPALLAKAFRGELVPQDPSDEPADKLLARIRAAAAAPGATATKRPKSPRKPRATTTDETMLTRQQISRSHLSSLLKTHGPLSPEKLWSASQLEIDDFYAQLKDEEANGLLREKAGERDSSLRLLEAA